MKIKNKMLLVAVLFGAQSLVNAAEGGKTKRLIQIIEKNKITLPSGQSCELTGLTEEELQKLPEHLELRSDNLEIEHLRNIPVNFDILNNVPIDRLTRFLEQLEEKGFTGRFIFENKSLITIFLSSKK